MTDRAVTAATLLRDIGLLADGPVRWGQPVRVGGPGVYVVELAAPLPDAPLELTKVGKWIERVPTLRLDGARPTSKQVVTRLAALWRPYATVLFVGSSPASVGGRVRALTSHALGDRRPHADGHWLHALKGIESLRIWWASTDAPEEALELALDAFAAAGAGALPGRPADALDLPWANLRRPTGERQAHGLTGSLLPDEIVPATPARRVTELPPGAAMGTTTDAKGSGTVRRAPRAAPPRPATARVATPRASRAASAVARPDLKREPVALTAEAIERMRAELDELTRVKRPEVVARIKSARELGDLRENAEYHAAREEQSFLEGRVRLLEDRLRHAVVIDETTAADRTGRVVLGSTVRLDHDGDELTFTIVGTTEANPAAGRISTVSPVGAALLGTAVGDDVEVRTPRGTTRYRVVAVD